MKIKVDQDLSTDNKVYKELDIFENTPEFKKIKKEYRNIGCKLTIGWE